MGDLAVMLLAALGGGALASALRLPPLVGFLAAGFALHAAGMQEPVGLDLVADAGVALLLFGIGLRLDLRTLIRREVWLSATVHLTASTVLGTLVLAALGALGVGLLADADWRTYAVVGFALSFSSTVFVVKLLEQRGSGQSLGGRTTIGILVIQDLAAVGFLVASHGEPPSPYALLLLLLLLLPASRLIGRLLDSLGHDELRPLFGITAALVPGYALFEAVGLHGDLGALVVGALLAYHPGASALSKTLLSVKELLLVGFFLSIGFIGLPTGEHLLVAALLLLLLPIKAVAFALLLWMMGLRRRTAVLAATALANFSEFGLIVAVAMPDEILNDDWLVSLATAIALSFTLASVVAGRSEGLVSLAQRLLPDRSTHKLHPEDRPIEVAHADAVVLGMGRVGRAAYDRLVHGFGLTVIGVESAGSRVEHLREGDYDVIEADATDPEFWIRLRAADVGIAVLAMPFHGNNLDALDKLTASGFSGTVAVVAQYDKDLAQGLRHGADTGIQLYEGAGSELADRAAAAAGEAGHGPAAGS